MIEERSAMLTAGLQYYYYYHITRRHVARILGARLLRAISFQALYTVISFTMLLSEARTAYTTPRDFLDECLMRIDFSFVVFPACAAL